MFVAMDQCLDFTKSLKSIVALFLNENILLLRQQCPANSLHLPFFLFLCKTVTLKTTWFFFQLCKSLFNVPMKHFKMSVSQGKTIQHLILNKIVMGCSLENPMLAKSE